MTNDKAYADEQRVDSLGFMVGWLVGACLIGLATAGFAYGNHEMVKIAWRLYVAFTVLDFFFGSSIVDIDPLGYKYYAQQQITKRIKTQRRLWGDYTDLHNTNFGPSLAKVAVDFVHFVLMVTLLWLGLMLYKMFVSWAMWYVRLGILVTKWRHAAA